MEKDSIIDKLKSNHHRFTALLLALPLEEYEREPNAKWSPGQHLDHIHRSVKPVTQAFGMPKFLLKWIFGKANRPSRNFEELVEKYK